MDDRTELLSIGQLARRTGLPVRTVRFWSDAGLVPPTSRSSGGYRLYDASAVQRLELVRTLRELGLSLDTVARVLREQSSLAEVAAAHVRALDAQIRILQLRRAVLRSTARRGSTTEGIRLMHKLASLSAEQRRQIIDEFVEQTFQGLDPQAPGAHIAEAMRQLPTDPAPEHLDAWVELAELVSDESFRQRVREMAVTGARPDPPTDALSRVDPALVQEHAGAALVDGVAPDSPAGQAVLDRIVAPETPAGDRLRLADNLATFTDRRVERYWQLLGVLNGRPSFPATVPAFEWLIEALRVSR